jgi:hypothetical protein
MHKSGFFRRKNNPVNVCLCSIFARENSHNSQEAKRICIFCTKLSGRFLTDLPYQEQHRFFYTVVKEIR